MLRKFLVGGFLLWAGIALIGQMVGIPRSGTAPNVQPSAISVTEPRLGLPAEAAAPPTRAFDSVLYVTANSLNLREAPSTSSAVITSLPQNYRLEAGEHRSGWVYVRSGQLIGWVSLDYVDTRMVDPPLQRPAAPISTSPAQLTGANCPSRLTCGQIGSCGEARYYLSNCSWGGRLDGDSDGVPCESMCR